MSNIFKFFSNSIIQSIIFKIALQLPHNNSHISLSTYTWTMKNVVISTLSRLFAFYFCSSVYRLSSETHKLAVFTFIVHFPNRRFTSDCNFLFASSKELAGIIVDCESVTLPLYITEKFNSY